jgi:hypothetical protein
MPVDWEKVERLRLERYGDARYGKPGVKAFAAAAGISFEQYRYHLEVGRGTRGTPPVRGGIPLAYVEGIAGALDVPVGELLNSETRNAEYERGLHNGRHQALAEVHQLLNGLMREDG